MRYEAGWVLEEGYTEVITTVWEKKMAEHGGWTHLETKLSACMQSLVQWRQQLHGPTNESIPRMREKLARLQGQDDMGNQTEIQRLKQKIQVQLNKEDLWWRQRAKVDWLKHGDRNTHYFHACVNSRRRKNSIEKVKDINGQLGTSTEDVQMAFIDYFTKLFTTGHEGDLGPCL